MARFAQVFTSLAAARKVKRIAKLDKRTIKETVEVIADEALARRLEPTTATRLPAITEERPVTR